jgi:hypothetical protein
MGFFLTLIYHAKRDLSANPAEDKEKENSPAVSRNKKK